MSETPIYTAVCKDEKYHPHLRKTIADHDGFMRRHKHTQWLKSALTKAGFKNGKHS